MIHFSFDTGTVKGWLLNAVLFGYFLLEMAIVGYILYLIYHGIPHQ